MGKVILFGGGRHSPMRPLWLCRACGAPWPCSPARLSLLADFRISPTAVRVLLWLYLYSAAMDLRSLTPSTPPDPVALAARAGRGPRGPSSDSLGPPS